MKTPDAISGFVSEGQSSILVKPHWILLLSGTLFFVLAIIVSLIAWQTYLDTDRKGAFLVLPGAIALFAGAIALHFSLAGVKRLVDFYFSYLLITPDYVVTLTGIARKVRPLETAKIEIPFVDESLPGRIIGYGFLRVSATGGGLLASFPVARPHQVLNQLNELKR